MYLPVVIRSTAGVKRDGTVFEGENYIDAKWCRFYRGLPRKINGYRTIARFLPEIARGLISYTENANTYIHVGSANLISNLTLDVSGTASVINNRTPAGFVGDDANIWQFDIIVDTNQVPPVNQIVAQVAPNNNCLCNSMGGKVYIGNLLGTSPLTEITDLAPNFVSATGGVVSLNPYLFVFGSDGSIGWSAPGRPTVFSTYEYTNYVSAFVTAAATLVNANYFIVEGDARGTFVIGESVRLNGATPSAFIEIVNAEYVATPAPGVTQVALAQNLSTVFPVGTTLTLQVQTLTGAGSVRAATQKIVRGLPLRGGGGNSPAGIFWSADAVIRGNFVGGDLVFSFDTLSVNSSILSAQSVVEQDGVYYWIGTDRFLQFNGVVRELPNPMNLNWFFDNLNRNYATKVFAFRVPRFGEIWWCFPFGLATECTHAIIYNIREQTWYDTVLPNNGRSAGEFSTVIARPLLCGTNRNDFFSNVGKTTTLAPTGQNKISVGGDVTALIGADTLITVRNNLSLGSLLVESATFNSGITAITLVANLPYDILLNSFVYVYTIGYNFWQHEYGVNEYGATFQQPIESYFETGDISLVTQSPPKNKVLSVNLIEPDFVQKGDLTVQITGSANARSVNETSDEITIYENPRSADQQVIHFKTERRLLRFKFKSNVIDGDYQMGQVLAHIAESDGRYLGGLK